ncbi:peptidylprolyl isomerase [Pedobacter deserti]|uniref:peptidylprolyl isomerase n=1 Tax=Pedobacter deserti TaxID=2817382 RepID=UPI00210E9F96|nr:peptidylprolyl isomerase [Pedobacter sp. SYSU D00382]
MIEFALGVYKRLMLTVALVFAFACSIYAQQTLIRLKTTKGDIVLMLYDKTPRHRDMFLREISKGTYRSAAFNRVIKDFVSQAGELDDSILNREQKHPELGRKRLPAEFVDSYIHKAGALGAGRDDNPEKSSYFNQIYLVAGKKFTDLQLDELEKKTGRQLSAAAREIYKTRGGTPHLDGGYTVFGEVVEGMEVASLINGVETDTSDVPLEPVIFEARVLSKAEANRLKRRLAAPITHR